VTDRWYVVVPVKPLPVAKSRLRADVPAWLHHQLVRALVLDSVEAVLACPLVAATVVVTADAELAEAVTRLGARVCPDPGGGLNAAVTAAAEQIGPAHPVAVLTGDLPAVRPEEIAAALHAAATSPDAASFVPDAAGTGTTMLAAPPGVPLPPRFGVDSAAAHAAAGARRLTGDWPGLRRDVDTAADLVAAAGYGLGRRTRRLWPVGATVPGMQGTVAEFDPDTQTGALLLDDGRRQRFEAAAFAASGLRLLRLGQRVQVEYAPDGTIQRIAVPTMRGY